MYLHITVIHWIIRHMSLFHGILDCRFLKWVDVIHWNVYYIPSMIRLLHAVTHKSLPCVGNAYQREPHIMNFFSLDWHKFTHLTWPQVSWSDTSPSIRTHLLVTETPYMIIIVVSFFIVQKCTWKKLDKLSSTWSPSTSTKHNFNPEYKYKYEYL